MQPSNTEDKGLKMFELVKEWEQSGKTKKAFCQLHGFTRDMFSYWANKYYQVHPSTREQKFISLSIDNKVPMEVFSATGTHANRPVTHNMSGNAGSITNSGNEIEIRYPNGVRLSVLSPSGIDLVALRTLVTLI
jgi:hypothetical protein